MPTPTITLRLPRPHPAQREILRSVARFNVLACGRRFGKTTLGVNRLIGPALEGFPVAWFAPTFKDLLEVWRDFLRVLAPVVARKSDQERRIELATGGVIEFWSLFNNPDAGRSRKYRRIIIDEAAKVRCLEAAWNEAIRPTLADFRGDADLYSTPKGRDFFARAFAWGEDPHEPDWKAFRFPTSTNPYIAAAEVEALRRKLPERAFRQEVLAEFLEEAGGVFRGVSAVVGPGRVAREPRDPGRSFVAGCDLARVEDFTVVTVLDATGRQVCHERFNKISWRRQILKVRAVARAYRCPVVLDSTGVGDAIHDALKNKGVRVRPYHISAATKEPLIDALAIAIEHGRLALMDLPVQTNELLSYEYNLSPSRHVTMSAPDGEHDDCVIALALAAWGIRSRREVRVIDV